MKFSYIAATDEGYLMDSDYSVRTWEADSHYSRYIPTRPEEYWNSWGVDIAFKEPISPHLLEQIKACLPTYVAWKKGKPNGKRLGVTTHELISYKVSVGTCEPCNKNTIRVVFPYSRAGTYGRQYRIEFLERLTEMLIGLHSCPTCGFADASDKTSAQH